MLLKFLGTGSAFTMTNRQSNLLLTSPEGKNLLIDCGSDIRHSLWKQDKSYLDIDAVYVSHLHADHIGGMEWLALATYFDPRYEGRPNLYIHRSMSSRLWNNAMSAGAETLQGDEQAKLSTYFNVKPVSKNKHFKWEGLKFNLVQTIHVVNKYSFEQSYGLMFDVGDSTIFFTSDTQHAPNQLRDFYEMSDIIFQDCETAFKSGVHAHYDELKELPAEIKAKMWLYHYNDGDLPNAKEDGFKGFVKLGQQFDLTNPPTFAYRQKKYVSNM